MFKIALIDSHLIKKGDYQQISQLCVEQGYKLSLLTCKTEDEVVAQASDADALLVVYTQVGDSLLSRLPKCKMAVRLGIGVDNYDLDAFTKHNVIACNVPDYGVEDVATHTLALILATERKICYFNQQIHQGKWDDGAGYPMRRLSQRTIGFYGFGRIAQKLSQFCAPLGYRMIAFDPFLPTQVFTDLSVEQVDEKTLFEQVDTIALMAPLTPETKYAICAKNLALAKEGLRIVNTARGELIENAALIEALNSGKVAAAGLDVLENEPLTDTEHQLMSFDNVTLTPHTAYQTVESIEILKVKGINTAIDFLQGKKPYHVVNPAVLTKT